MAYFTFGSTVVLLFEKDMFERELKDIMIDSRAIVGWTGHPINNFHFINQRFDKLVL